MKFEPISYEAYEKLLHVFGKNILFVSAPEEDLICMGITMKNLGITFYPRRDK